MQDQSPTLNRRASKVCSRCKKRKTKCDFKFPACTPCLQAKVGCQGYDTVSGQEVPRSLVRSLEGQIAELEAQLEQSRRAQVQNERDLTFGIAKATVSVGTPHSRSFFASSISSTIFLQSSLPPLAIARQQNPKDLETPEQQLKQGGSSQQSIEPGRTLKDVPVLAVTHMIKNYVNFHLPQYPIFTEQWLRGATERVVEVQSNVQDTCKKSNDNRKANLSHFDHFIVSIVFAISSLTLTWRAEAHARAASHSFYSSALEHLERLVDIDDIESLQISLLLAHYALMNPEVLDTWACIDNATRIVLDLGLFKQHEGIFGVEQEETRSRLFWVTYNMGRTLCNMLRLPLSFPEETIMLNVPLPSDIPPTPPAAISNEVMNQTVANHIYTYRRLETEVHRVLHLVEDTPQLCEMGMAAWLHDVASQLELWYDKSHQFAGFSLHEYRHVQYHYLKAKIHRPTPRLWLRSIEDQEIYIDECQKIIGGVQTDAKHRTLFYTWEGMIMAYGAAVLLMDACWLARDQTPVAPRIFHSISVVIPECLSLLENIGEHWRVSEICARYLQPIMEEVATVYNLGSSDRTHTVSAEDTSEKIKRLMFADGPLLDAFSSIDLFQATESSPRSSRNSLYVPPFDILNFDMDWDPAEDSCIT